VHLVWVQLQVGWAQCSSLAFVRRPATKISCCTRSSWRSLCLLSPVFWGLSVIKFNTGTSIWRVYVTRISKVGIRWWQQGCL